MSKDLSLSLQQVALVTFEELAFMFPADEQGAGQQAKHAGTSVEFRGPQSGRLIITTNESVMAVLAANMLGESLAPSGANQRDALGELANVICGNVLPKINDPKDVFHLDAPQFIDLAETPLSPVKGPAAQVQIDLDEGPVELLLFIDEEVVF